MKLSKIQADKKILSGIFVTFGLILTLVIAVSFTVINTDTRSFAKTPCEPCGGSGGASCLNSNTYIQCKNGCWQTRNCPYGCSKGFCLLCPAGQARCYNNTPQSCSGAQGVVNWNGSMPCPTPKICQVAANHYSSGCK